MALPKRAGRYVYWLLWPALFVYLRRGSRTRVLVMAEGRVLLVKGWMSDTSWGLPGGGLHAGEDPRSGAVRELFEETGVQVEAVRLQLLGSERLSHEGLSFYCHFFAVQLKERVELRRQPGEIIAAEWLDLDHIEPALCKKEVGRAVELMARQA